MDMKIKKIFCSGNKINNIIANYNKYQSWT